MVEEEYTEKYFFNMARNNPERIIELFKENILNTKDKYSAILALSCLEDSKMAREILTPFLEDPNPGIVYNALFSLRNHCDNKTLNKIKNVSENNSNFYVRQKAKDIIGELKTNVEMSNL